LVEAVAVDLLAVLLFGAGAGAAKDATASAIISKAVFMLILPRGLCPSPALKFIMRLCAEKPYRLPRL